MTCSHIDFVIIPEDDSMKMPASYTLTDENGETIQPGLIGEYFVAALMNRQMGSQICL